MSPREFAASLGVFKDAFIHCLVYSTTEGCSGHWNPLSVLVQVAGEAEGAADIRRDPGGQGGGG